MIINKESLSIHKYLLIEKILNDKCNKKLFDSYDTLLTIKRFDDVKDLSLTENILSIGVINLKPVEISNIVNSFINIKQTAKINEKRNLYEILKISNLPTQKINNALNDSKLMLLGDKFQDVSCETNLLSIDFAILRALDNFILKVKNPAIKNNFNAKRKIIIRKIITNNYEPEIKEKKIIYLSWIDRVLTATINKEISLNDYITINKKIFNLIPDSLDLYWKILHSINYLCFHPCFDDSNILRKFRRSVLKIINNKYDLCTYDQSKTKDLTISILAEQDINKENFYYLFDVISILSKKTDDDKLFCLNILDYLIYLNQRQSIFHYRFIREAFLHTFLNLISINDNFQIQEKEINILIELFHIDIFFHLNRFDLFERMINILRCIKKYNDKNIQIKFYKYCDILDYILTYNKDIKKPDWATIFSCTKDEYKKISKHFCLSGFVTNF